MFSTSRRRNRSRSKGRSRKKGRNAGNGAGVKALVVAGVAAGGWFGVQAYRGENPMPPALSAQPSKLAGEAVPGVVNAEAQPNGAPAASTVGQRAKGPVPASLRGAVARAQRSQDPLAINELRRLVVEYPHTPEAQQAQRALGGVLEVAEQRAASAKDVATRLREWTRIYLATLDANDRRALRPQLTELAKEAFFQRGATTFVTTYAVQSGDSLARIAKRHKTDYRLVKRLNGLTRDTIRIGQKLRIPTAKVRIVVYKRDFELIALFGDCFLCSYDVATGKQDRTPEASFVIGNKIIKPDWYAPDGKKHVYGSEENVLGTRWMAFENTSEHEGFGIHGTKFPESIGTEASMGCLRMRNAEVEVLFDLIPPRTKVFIQR